MALFNPENKTNLTVGEMLDPAMRITDQDEADRYLEAYIRWHMRIFGKTRKEAEMQTRSSLGYYAGYYDNKTRLRVEKLFRCGHPVFGKAKDSGEGE